MAANEAFLGFVFSPLERAVEYQGVSRQKVTNALTEKKAFERTENDAHETS